MQDLGSGRRFRVVAHLVLLSALPVLLLAGTTDQAANLFACRSGGPSCERSRLTEMQLTEVTRAERARNVSSCRNGLSSCDQSQLSEAEAITVAVAAYDRNVSNCTAGLTPCDPSGLTRSEARRRRRPCVNATSPIARTASACATPPSSPGRSVPTWRAPSAATPSPIARTAW